MENKFGRGQDKRKANKMKNRKELEKEFDELADNLSIKEALIKYFGNEEVGKHNLAVLKGWIFSTFDEMMGY